MEGLSVLGWLRRRQQRRFRAVWLDAVAEALADEGADPEQVRRWKSGEHVLLHEMFRLPDYRRPPPL